VACRVAELYLWASTQDALVISTIVQTLAPKTIRTKDASRARSRFCAEDSLCKATMLTMLSEGEDLSGAEKVFAFFRDALLDGSLKPGERLLSERELSLRLGVSRPLLREALRSLAMLDFLDIQHGKGAYVRQADINVLSDFFTFSLAQQPDIHDDVMQARIAIECQAIRLACERATEGDLKRIGSKLTRLMDTLHDPVEGGIADFAFHQAIVEASHSEALTTLYGAIGELLRMPSVGVAGQRS
jgi:DNA-binding FadR family transcriptional regulator